MILVQLTGLSGAGKTTLSKLAIEKLRQRGISAESIDGDVYRNGLCRDLGFSAEDRRENIRRLGFVGRALARNGVVAILAAINPYDDVRREIAADADVAVKTVWIDCDLETLAARDTKGLYERAMLPDGDPRKLTNLTGVNDPYEAPSDADLTIRTAGESVEESASRLLDFILAETIGERNVRRAMFIGRWQPFHNGHKWLIDQKLAAGVPVLIAVRDIEPDAANPLTTAQTVEILEKLYEGRDARVIIIPDIESVNFGRGVGYQINEFVPPPEIHAVSATSIRAQIRSGESSWKSDVDPKIHDLVERYLA